MPFRINEYDKGANVHLDKIDCALKSAARTITQTRLKDKIRSEVVLHRAGLKSLDEMVAYSSAVMVWKSKQRMDPLGSLLFPEEPINPEFNIELLSAKSRKTDIPVPGHGTLAAILLARSWNESTDIQNATTLSADKTAARKWSKSLV